MVLEFGLVCPNSVVFKIVIRYKNCEERNSAWLPVLYSDLSMDLLNDSQQDYFPSADWY